MENEKKGKKCDLQNGFDDQTGWIIERRES